MMLTSFSLCNFKSWRNTGEQRLAPITILFGGNSSGKSSILHWLLMLKQTAESPDRKRVFHLGDRYSIVDLGTFSDIVHNHDTSKCVSFNLQWNSQDIRMHDTYSDKTYNSKSIKFCCEVSQHTDQSIKVNKLIYSLPSENISFSLEKNKTKDKYDLKSENYGTVRNLGRKWDLPAPIKCYGFPEEAAAYFQNTSFLYLFNYHTEILLKSINYLGPLRIFPERLYIWSGEQPENVGKRGERTIDAILSAKGRLFNFRNKEKRQSFEEIVASWLKNLGLIHSFKTNPLGENRKEYEVLIQTAEGKPEVKLTDVGFGVSQVLPVIAQCFFPPPDSILLFEQPELHLHPKVQSGMADLFIQAIRARENGKNRNIQIIVESHSEHFLHRLMRRVAEGDISKEEIAIYFCHNTPEGSVMSPLDVDEYGNIRNWPENFFGDEMEDIMARTDAAMKRQMPQGKK